MSTFLDLRGRSLRPLAVRIIQAILFSSISTFAFGGYFTRELTVFTVAEVTEAGKRVPAATPEAPVYYEACSLGYMDVGRSKNGHIVPTKQQMIRRIVKTLADQGYVLASKEHPPTQFLIFFWGTIDGNFGSALKFMGGDRLNLMWELENTPQNHNPNILLRGLRSAEASLIMESAKSELFVMQIQSYDQKKIRNGELELLWQTKVSAPSQGLIMDVSMDGMIKLAGPHFGQDRDKPVLTYASDRKELIELGDLQVLENIDTDKIPVVDWAQVQQAKREAEIFPKAPAKSDAKGL